MPEMWLTLYEGVSMSIDLDEALRLDEAGFAKLYRRHVLTASRKQAKAWAREQVEKRAAALAPAVGPGEEAAQ